MHKELQNVNMQITPWNLKSETKVFLFYPLTFDI